MTLSVEQNTAAHITEIAYTVAMEIVGRDAVTKGQTAWIDDLHRHALDVLPGVVKTYYRATSELRGESENPVADFLTE